MVLIDVACNHESFSIINFFFQILNSFSDCIIVFVPCMETSLIFCLCFYLLCRRANNPFDVRFQRIGPAPFPSEDAKDAVLEERNGRKGFFFPPESASLFFDK